MRRGGKAATDIDRPDSHAFTLSDEGRDSYIDIRHTFHPLVPRAIANLEPSAKRAHIGRAKLRPPITSERESQFSNT
jgi:hypothetical protein